MRGDCGSESVLRGLTGPCNCSSVHVKYPHQTFVGTSLLACTATTGLAYKACVCVCLSILCSSGAVHVRDNMIKGDEESRSERSFVWPLSVERLHRAGLRTRRCMCVSLLPPSSFSVFLILHNNRGQDQSLHRPNKFNFPKTNWSWFRCPLCSTVIGNVNIRSTLAPLSAINTFKWTR